MYTSETGVEIYESEVEEQGFGIPVTPADIGRFIRNDEEDDFGGDDDNSIVTRVMVCRPKKTWWIYAHPDKKYAKRVGILEPTDDKEDIYVVADDVCEQLGGETTFKWKRLVPTMTARGILFL